MRVLLAIGLVAAAGWGGWWWWSASLREAAVRDWLAARQAEGWVAEAASIEVDGFPSRVDLTVTDLRLADPDEGWSWQAPGFEVLSLSWKPNHFVVAWPGEQVVATPYETARIASELMRGSVVFEPGLALALDRMTVEIEDMAITGAAGWRAALDEALLSVRRAGGEDDAPEDAPDGAPKDAPIDAPNAYELSFVAETLALPEAWVAEIDRTGVLPRVVEAAELDAVLAYDRPWDREAVEGETPSLEAMRVRALRVSWGRLDLRGRGALEADAEGYAQGRLDLRIRNWRDMLAVAIDSGLVARGTAQAIETGLSLVAQLSGSGDALEVPLLFEDGRTLIEAPFGAVPIGEAPRLSGG